MIKRINNEIIKTLLAIEITNDVIDLEKEGIKGPSSTWTYMINDSPDQFSNLPHLIKACSTMASRLLFTVQSIIKNIGKK